MEELDGVAGGAVREWGGSALNEAECLGVPAPGIACAGAVGAALAGTSRRGGCGRAGGGW